MLQRVERAGYAESFSSILESVGLRKSHLVLPVFVSEKQGKIDSMPGMATTPVRELERHVQRITDSGISSIILFGVPSTRDASGISAADKDGIVQRGVRAIKSLFGSSMGIMTDVCVCQYNASGHCGIVQDGHVDNDSTVYILTEIAASHAEAGADFVAPSSMMDGQVQAIRTALDDRGLETGILSYSAKHASTLYTPFRAAAFARQNLKVDKSSYQVSYANPRQAMREIEADIREGADMVMIKPALAYLDLIRMAKDQFGFPLAAQNVSGEYAMIKQAALRGWIDEEEWKIHSLASIRRAGADRIISYFSLDVAEYL